MAVLDLKAKIAEKTNIPAGMQRVIFKGKVLHDDKDLSFYCIFNQLLYISSSSSFFFLSHKAVQEGHALHMVERPAQTSIHPTICFLSILIITIDDTPQNQTQAPQPQTQPQLQQMPPMMGGIETSPTC